MPIKRKANTDKKQQKTTIKDLEAKLNTLTNVLTQFISNQNQPIPENTNQTIINQDNSVIQNNTTSRRRRRNIWSNNFVDDGITHAEDKITDKLLAKIPPVEKGKRKNNLSSSTCRECGIVELVPIQTIFESKHTCGKCLRKKVGTAR